MRIEQVSAVGVLFALCAGCGAASPEVESPSRAAKGEASSAQDGSFVPPPPIGMAFGGEDPGVKRVLGKQAWAYVPPRKDFPESELALLEVVKQEGTKVTFASGDSEGETFLIPQAFSAPTQTPVVAVGDLVLTSFLSKSQCGRVRALEAGKVEVEFLWGSTPKREQVATDAILPLATREPAFSFGSPALVRGDGGMGDFYERYWALHADADHVWLAATEFGGDAEKKAARADVQPLALGRFAKGDAVMACGGLALGCFETTVLAELHDGLAFEVAIPQELADRVEGKTASISTCAVGRRPVPRAFGGEAPSEASPRPSLPGSRAWVYQPGEGLVLRTIAKQSGARTSFFTTGDSGQTFELPRAFTAPISSAKLGAGDLVWVGGRAKGPAVCGRVVRASGKDVEVVVVDAVASAKQRVARELVLPLPKEMSFGAPIVDGSDLLTVVYADDAEACAFPPSSPNHEHETRAPRSRAEVLAPSSKLKKGDAVRACDGEGCRDTTIVRVLDDGLRYEVEDPGGSEKPVVFAACAVGKAP